MLRLLVHAVWLVLFSQTLSAAEAKDPELVLDSGSAKLVFTRKALLSRPDVTTIEVKEDPAYGGKAMAYKAVPAAALFSSWDLPSDAVIQFRCTDGFSAPISKDRILNTDAARSLAYVAIEPAEAPWPPIKPGGPSAGPFYLIWAKPDLSAIAQEEWPFQLAAFSVKGSLEALYPRIIPGKDASAEVTLGFQTFTKNCFPCHTLNKNGAGEVGPDLNLPLSPTEYFTPAALKRLIRNPQDVRYFPKSRMSPFPAAVLPDKELAALITYLSYMAKHRATN